MKGPRRQERNSNEAKHPSGGGASRGRHPRNGLRRGNGCDQGGRRSGREGVMQNGTLFAPYWTVEETQRKLMLGQCFSGVLRVNVKNGDEGYVTLPGLKHDVMFRKGRFQNRAMVGDTVAYRVMPTRFWWVVRSVKPLKDVELELPSDEEMEKMDGPQRRMALLHAAVKRCMHQRQNEDVDRVNLPPIWDHAASPAEAKDLVNELEKYFPELRPTAEVVSLIEASSKRYELVGVLQAELRRQLLYFLPLDPALPKRFFVSTHNFGPQAQTLINEACVEENETRTILTAQFFRWEANEEIPTAIMCGVLGPTGNIESETMAILRSNGVGEMPFTQEALNSLPGASWEPSEAELEGRWDFRETCVFSIDPPTARDIDDALSIEQLDSDLFKVGVHIADVSHFVWSGSPLDCEAQRRTTSVYLVQRVIPMLPERLSANLCSLRPGVDRLTFSVVWEMNRAGEVYNVDFNKSIIHSCAQLAYAHAQAAIEDASAAAPDDISIHAGYSWGQVKSNIRLLFEISQSLRAKRHENGALRLDLPKMWFKLDENGFPEEAGSFCQKEANYLIQEFMLLANMSVARFISEIYPEHSLLRSHPPPKTSLMGELLELAGEMKIDTDLSTAAGIQRALMELHEKFQDGDVVDAITKIATRPMQLAEYFCTGLFEEENWKHYALAVNHYTHFTSPIRRYPDIVVHRLLQAAITVGKGFCEKLDREQMYHVQLTADMCNKGKTSARNAQDQCINLFLKLWLEKQPVETFGVVASLKGSKFFDVYIPQFAISSRIMSEDLPRDTQADFDKEKAILTVRKKEQILGDEEEDKDKDSFEDGTSDANRPSLQAEKIDCDDYVHVKFEWDGDHLSVLFQPASKREEVANDETYPPQVDFIDCKEASGADIPLDQNPSIQNNHPSVRIEFIVVNDTVEVKLLAIESRENLQEEKPLSKLPPQDCQEKAASGSGVLDEASVVSPLHFPFQITRFSKVPVKVWVKRCVTLGKLMDIKVDLLIADA